MSVSVGSPSPGAVRYQESRPRLPAMTIVLVAASVHLVAAAATYRDVVTDLYALFAAAPQLSVMARGLTKLLAISVFLPPILPTLLLAACAIRLRGAPRGVGVGRWLALGCATLAADSALRALGVLAAPPPANLGDALDLQNRLAPGVRMIAELAGAQPGPAVGYWLAIFTLGAMGAIGCSARALHEAERASRQPSVGRRRRHGDGGIGALQSLLAALGGYLLLGALGKVALPVATQLVLKLFG